MSLFALIFAAWAVEPAVIATVDGVPVSAAQVDADADVQAALAELHTARVAAMEARIEEQLLAAEAGRRGIDVDALLAAEVSSKVKDPSGPEVRAFYDANRDRIQGEFRDLKERIADHLRTTAEEARRSAFLGELAAKAKVERFLDAWRVDVPVAANPRLRGPASAAVRIVMYSDFECPYCARGATTVGEAASMYPTQVSVEYRDFPLAFHPHAARAAEAGLCAHEQGVFWGFHDAIFDGAGLEDADLVRVAVAAGAERGAFEACLKDGRHVARVAASQAEGAALGVQGTPAFFINGRPLSGAQPMAEFVRIIEDELARSPSR